MKTYIILLILITQSLAAGLKSHTGIEFTLEETPKEGEPYRLLVKNYFDQDVTFEYLGEPAMSHLYIVDSNGERFDCTPSRERARRRTFVILLAKGKRIEWGEIKFHHREVAKLQIDIKHLFPHFKGEIAILGGSFPVSIGETTFNASFEFNLNSEDAEAGLNHSTEGE